MKSIDNVSSSVGGVTSDAPPVKPFNEDSLADVLIGLEYPRGSLTKGEIVSAHLRATICMAYQDSGPAVLSDDLYKQMMLMLAGGA